MFVQSLVTPRMCLQYFKLSFSISHSLKISNIGRVFLFCVMLKTPQFSQPYSTMGLMQ